MTLTTEQLAKIKAGIAARKAMPKHDGSIEVSLDRGQVIHRTRDVFSTVTVEMLVNALDELLANREAQPVAEPYMYELWKWDETVPELDRWFLVERSHEKLVAGKEQKVVILYTAPPAPAANTSPDFETWFVEKYKQPERLMKNGNGTYKFSGVQMAFSAWSACRAAMLENIDKPAPQLDSVVTRHADQSVSSGYKLPDGWKLVPVEPTEGMLAAAYRNGEAYSAKAYRAMLAAAPEGGN
ncbi:TPA: hypothetical protein ACKP2K_001533 [Serratia marcescens]